MTIKPLTRVIFWDFDGTLATRAGMWSGALVDALAAYDPACGVTRAQLAPFLRAGFPWHTPERGPKASCGLAGRRSALDRRRFRISRLAVVTRRARGGHDTKP